MRYEITIKKGRKIVERHHRDDYLDALELLDRIENLIGFEYRVEFRDRKPFA